MEQTDGLNVCDDIHFKTDPTPPPLFSSTEMSMSHTELESPACELLNIIIPTPLAKIKDQGNHLYCSTFTCLVLVIN